MPLKVVVDEQDKDNPAMQGLLDAFRARIDKAQEVLDSARRAIRKGEPVVLACADDEITRSYKAILDDVCREVWGAPLAWDKEEFSQCWCATTPPAMPPVPPFCMSCGAIVPPNATNITWRSPGKAGVKHKATGWEHKCVVDCPQAGYFPMDDDNPYDAGTVEADKYVEDRFLNWKLQAQKRAVQAANEAVKERRDTSGHDFIGEPQCLACGLSYQAYKTIPPVYRWVCENERIRIICEK